jgi:hypothetical protein
MASFTVRVELTDADWEEYDVLHEQMENRGFSRTITNDSGTEYQLPDAEYNFEGNKTRSEVLALAKAASAETGKRHKILVTESKGRTWFQLDRV